LAQKLKKMPAHSIINHKGKEILYVDYQNLKEEEIIQAMDDATEYALQLNRPMLRLSNMTGAYAVPNVFKKAKESGKRTEHLTIKRAAVGITGAKKVLINAFNAFTGNNAKAFDTVEEAKDWLVS
jgi:hypothetical protein